MTRGFFKQAAGPGWALVGDAGHFKHPITAQGISDAIEQALWIASALNGDDPMLDGYEAWRDARAAGHYELSFSFAIWPDAPTAQMLANLMSESDACQDLRDVFARTVHPRQLFSPERVTRWTTPA